MAEDTVAPPTFIGSKTATGVIAPVLPVCNLISFNFVVCSSEGNLNATAHRGAFEVKPSSSWVCKESTFKTAPSI